MLNEQKVGCEICPFDCAVSSFSPYQQALSLVEVAELINKFDPSTEGKECIEMGVDGSFFFRRRFLGK